VGEKQPAAQTQENLAAMKPKPPKDPLKAARKGSREAEIEMHGHPLPKHKMHKSKKQYDRKDTKARLDEGESLVFQDFHGCLDKIC
jgi:hypothetical protein